MDNWGIAIVGLIAAIGGGAIAKGIEVLFLPKTKEADIAAEIRQELRGDVKSCKDELQKIRNEASRTMNFCYTILGEYASLYYRFVKLANEKPENEREDLLKGIVEPDDLGEPEPINVA